MVRFPPLLGFLALTAAAMSGCATQQSLEQSRASPTRTITWVMVEDPKRVCGEVIPGRFLWNIDACADWRDPHNCIVYAKPPANAEDRQAMLRLGHEMLHCFVGDFHNPYAAVSMPKPGRSQLAKPVGDHVDADDGERERDARKETHPVTPG